MGATIKDVARLASVAPSTVSRVLSDHPKISNETKKRVKRAMEQLDYHPNLNARSLANKSTNSLGLIVHGGCERFFQNPFFSEVLKGISEYTQEENYSLYFTTSTGEIPLVELVEGMIKGKRVDGTILLNAKVSDQVLELLYKQKFPTVVIGKPDLATSSVTTVDTNNFLAGRDAALYLLKKGHKKIGFVGGSESLMVTRERYSGVKNAIRTMDLPLISEHQYLNIENGKDIEARMNFNEDLPTGLVVMDDLLASEVMEVLHRRKIRVPEDISIISFNNSYLCELMTPQLTSVNINISRLGYEAAKTVIESIRNENMYPKQVFISHNIIERNSVKDLNKLSTPKNRRVNL